VPVYRGDSIIDALLDREPVEEIQHVLRDEAKLGTHILQTLSTIDIALLNYGKRAVSNTIVYCMYYILCGASLVDSSPHW